MVRYIVVDDSGSMNTPDGRDRYGNSTSRWAEMCESLKLQLQLSLDIGMQTYVLFFHHNGHPTNEIVALTPESHARILQRLQDAPSNDTPLYDRLEEVHAHMKNLHLRMPVSLLLYSDGCDDHAGVQRGYSELNQLLRKHFRGVYVVINLCTDDSDVVAFWNCAGDGLESNLDVLDDFGAEAREVQQRQPWLVYTYWMHEFRKVMRHPLYQKLDDVTLTCVEIQDFVLLTWGVAPDVHQPVWEMYLGVWDTWACTQKEFNVVTKRSEPPIDVYLLRHGHKRTAGWGMLCLVLLTLLLAAGVWAAPEWASEWISLFVFPHVVLTDDL
jgi:hypothetical protein